MNIIHINFFFVYQLNVSVHRTVCTANTENRLKINWTDFYFETVSALNPNEPRKKADNLETYLQWLFSVRCANKTPTKFIIYHEKCSKGFFLFATATISTNTNITNIKCAGPNSTDTHIFETLAVSVEHT